MARFNTRKLVVTALFVAIGVALPVAMHAVPNAGSVLLPMHIPVLLCGLACGWLYGLACGLLTPFMSSLITGMPSMAYLPSMLCELAAYGLVSGLLFKLVKTRSRMANLYIALVGAMIVGRIVYGTLNALIFRAGAYSMQVWLTSAFVTSLPGIIIQLVLIPILITALSKAKLTDMNLGR